MSALPKILIILVLWFVYTLILFQGCSDTLCLGCGAEGEAVGAVVPPDTESPAAAAAVTYPLSFRWDSAEPLTDEAFPAFRDSLLNAAEADNILEITGLYYDEEDVPEGYDNLGFARATQVRELFGDDLGEDRIRIRARLVQEREGVRENPFQGALFEWIEPEEQIAETVEELPDRVNIRFPYNSVEKEYDPEVEAYFEQLADNLKETGRRVMLTGHADNTGEVDYNYQLGLDRANSIRQVLINNGVPESQIVVQSKGETQPIASNATEEGRHENRRVEIRIIEDPSN